MGCEFSRNTVINTKNTLPDGMNSTSEQLRFASIPGHIIRADFNGGGLSSDLGPLLLRGVDCQIGLTERINAALVDTRHASYITHSQRALLTQRIYQIGCGYEDGNDSNCLRHDPMFKLGAGRLPFDEDTALASATTMSRLNTRPAARTFIASARSWSSNSSPALPVRQACLCSTSTIPKMRPMASATLARETGIVRRLNAVLGERCAGIFTGIVAQTPRTSVVAAAEQARTAGADLLLGMGGRSITDAAKMVALCLANDIGEPAALDRLRSTTRPDGSTVRPEVRAPAIATVIIPTTLSAGEFSAAAGCTDTSTGRKESYGHPGAMPRTVILDPAVTVHTPQLLWLSTGVRAIDHAVEDLCAINSKPFSDATSRHALTLLGRGLRAVRADPASLRARLDCQLGAWMSIVGSSAGVSRAPATTSAMCWEEPPASRTATPPV